MLVREQVIYIKTVPNRVTYKGGIVGCRSRPGANGPSHLFWACIDVQCRNVNTERARSAQGDSAQDKAMEPSPLTQVSQQSFQPKIINLYETLFRVCTFPPPTLRARC
jgi:hypothetical protein